MLNRLRQAFGRPRKAPIYVDPPEGTFEIIGKRCLGMVVARDNPRPFEISITIELNYQIVKEFLIKKDKKSGKYSFSVNAEPPLTIVDFVRERAMVYAENAYGLRGKLILDGPCQLGLIREYLGKPRDVLFDLDFTAGGNAADCFGKGWSRPEPRLCCSDGPAASLRVPTHISGDDRHELTLSCLPFLAPPHLTIQTMAISLNGIPQILRFDSKQIGFASLLYPAGQLASSEYADIDFEFPDCFRPDEYSGNGDRRLLAFAFKQATLVRLLPSI